jgi:acyl-CoA thioester hydrolase
MAPVQGFAFTHRQTVRFRDADLLGHVNNAVYATYVEEARFAYLESLGLAGRDRMLPMILARLELDFRAQLAPGGEVVVGVRPARVGTKSFELEYRIESAGIVTAEARTVLVSFDYEAQATIPVPDAWRTALEAGMITA